GLAVLGMAWLYLGRALRRGEEGTDTGRLLKIAALWGAPLVFSVPLFSRDLYAYAAQAQIAHAGLDPYRFGPVSLPGPFLDEISGMWVDTPAPYGPLFLGIGRAVATVTGDRVVTTVFVMRLVAVVGVLLTARYLPRLARAAGGDPRVAVWLGIANPLVLAHFVAGGHNDALMVGLVVAGLTVAIEATEERWVAVGVVLCSAAVLVKAPAAVAVAFLAWVWAGRLSGRAVLVRACLRTGVVAAVSITVITGLTGLGFGWIDQLNASSQVLTWVSVPTAIGMLIELLRGVPNFVTYQDPVIAAVRFGGQVVTAAVLFWLWLRAGRVGADARAVAARGGVPRPGRAALVCAVGADRARRDPAGPAGVAGVRRHQLLAVDDDRAAGLEPVPRLGAGDRDAAGRRGGHDRGAGPVPGRGGRAGRRAGQAGGLRASRRPGARAGGLGPVSARELDAAGITDPALRASYEWCRRLNAAHGRTYYLATLLLPPAKRPYVHALYGFARY